MWHLHKQLIKDKPPKFRLPVGKVLEPRMNYTVSSKRADIKTATFKAIEIQHLNNWEVTKQSVSFVAK